MNVWCDTTSDPTFESILPYIYKYLIYSCASKKKKSILWLIIYLYFTMENIFQLSFYIQLYTYVKLNILLELNLIIIRVNRFSPLQVSEFCVTPVIFFRLLPCKFFFIYPLLLMWQTKSQVFFWHDNWLFACHVNKWR
jgi:hypothetical protein